MINTEILDEFFNNTIDNDFSNIFGDDPNEEREDKKQFELSYDNKKCSTHGTSQCTFSTTLRSKFDSFYYYLHSHGYNIMKSSEAFPYKIYVFGLTKLEADLLTNKFYGDRRLVPMQKSLQAA